MTLFPRIMFNAGRSSGRGALGRGGPFDPGDGFEASSYEGGGSRGVFWSLIAIDSDENT